MAHNILACIDGSSHADSVCELAAWVANRTELTVTALHAIPPHSDLAAKGNLSGSIGLGAKSDLLKELTEMDVERGKLEQKKGKLMLAHAEEELKKHKVKTLETLHRHGALVDTIEDLESDAAIIIMGKRGEQAENAPDHLGSNLERVARSIHKPLLITPQSPKAIKRFLIAYDGSASSKKALDFVRNSKLLERLECHLLKISEDNTETQIMLTNATSSLEKAGFEVTAKLEPGKPVAKLVNDYIEKNDIHLLVTGAYGHSKIHNLILGSNTTTLIHDTNVPVLLVK